MLDNEYNEYREELLKKLSKMTAHELKSLLDRKPVEAHRGDYHFNQYDGEPWFYK